MISVGFFAASARLWTLYSPRKGQLPTKLQFCEVLTRIDNVRIPTLRTATAVYMIEADNGRTQCNDKVLNCWCKSVLVLQNDTHWRDRGPTKGLLRGFRKHRRGQRFDAYRLPPCLTSATLLRAKHFHAISVCGGQLSLQNSGSLKSCQIVMPRSDVIPFESRNQ